MKKSLFRFHKPDEMERYILFKSQRNAYLFLVIALMLWSFYESFQVYTQHTRLNPIPCMLLAAALATQTLSQLIMTRSAVKDDEDSYETAPLFRLILFACAAAGIIAAIGAAILLMGVQT